MRQGKGYAGLVWFDWNSRAHTHFEQHRRNMQFSLEGQIDDVINTFPLPLQKVARAESDAP